MSRLEKTIRNISKAAQIRPQYVKGQPPSFNEKGVLLRPGLKRVLTRTAIIAAVFAILTAFLYLPQSFMNEESTVVNGDLMFDPSAVTLINDARTANWSGDFDGDGLDNQEEMDLMTDPYHPDTDGDRIMDYAEVYVTKTSPIAYNDTLLSNKELEDEINGTRLQTPYKVGNVILWADNYRSKAYGSVVETPTGYRICGFSGYAQFPVYENWYAYRYSDGIHEKLKYLESEQAWKVSAGDRIVLYPYELEEKVCFTFFGKELVSESNSVTRFLARILPDRGFITAQALTDTDLVYQSPEAVMSDIRDPGNSDPAMDRFQKNSFLLSDIQKVREAIDNNECVYFTIYHESLGEKCGIIYGYYKDDTTLLVADPGTLEYVGNIKITERATMMIVNSGETVSYEYFTFSGFGASTADGFKINFYSLD